MTSKFEVCLIFCLVFLTCSRVCSQPEKPNFIFIFTDDLGYGDLSSFGHPTIKTPNIDRMVHEGQKWTNFYVAANVCSPSRGSILTGRLPVRTGIYGVERWVLFPDSKGGIPQEEITVAELLKEAGYSTAAIGKWHLGHLPEYLPMNHGFDYYYGIPYSNDMDWVGGNIPYQDYFIDPDYENFNVPLMRNEKIIERPANQHTITKRYTEEAVRYIHENKEEPFFIHFAHNFPHVPLFASSDFEGKSARGLYGDVVEEIDWSVGEIINAVIENNLENNTYIIFTSDNGPWLTFGEQGGSSGLLYGGKGTSYEGGMRVPTAVWGGNIKPAIIDKIGSTLDILPTFCQLANVELPSDRIYDGYDLSGIWENREVNPRREMFYYHTDQLFAVRRGDYKMYLMKNNPEGYPERLSELDEPMLYNLVKDPSERFDVSDKHPKVIQEIRDLIDQHNSEMEIKQPIFDLK